MYATGLAVGFASAVIHHRKELWKEVQYFCDKKMFKNSRTTLHTRTKDGKCDVLLREIDPEGQVVNERRWTIDSTDRSLTRHDSEYGNNGDFPDFPVKHAKSLKSLKSMKSMKSVKCAMFNLEEVEQEDKLTPLASDVKLQAITEPLTARKKKTRIVRSFRNKVKKKLQSTQDKPPSEGKPAEKVQSDVCSITSTPDSGSSSSFSETSSNSTYKAASGSSSDIASSSSGTYVESSASSTWDNGDDDLYDMPKVYELKQFQKKFDARNRSLRMQSRLETHSARSSRDTYSMRSSMITASDQVSISETSSILTVSTESTTYTSASNRSHGSNNDFLEYERRLRESDSGLHNIQTRRRPFNRIPVSVDNQSSVSTGAPPSLSHSSRSVITEESVARSSVISELETPYSSDVSTLDRSSIVFRDEDIGSLRSSTFPRYARAHY